MKMNVLYILASSSMYGTSKSLLVLLNALDKDKFRPYAVLNSSGPLVGEIRKISVPVTVLPLKRWIIPKKSFVFILPNLLFQVYSIIMLLFFIKRNKISVVQTFDSTAIEGAIAARLAGLPHIWRISEILETHPDLNPVTGRKHAYSIIHALSTYVIPVSSAVARCFDKYSQSPKMRIVHNAIDTARYSNSPEQKDIRSEFNIPEQTPVIGIVSSFSKEKGMEDFLKAAHITNRKNGGYTYLIAGSGSRTYVEFLKKLARGYNLDKNCIFAGFTDNVVPLYRAFDIFVMPSWIDSFARVLLEAMSLKKPVIAVNEGGTPEIVEHGVTGILVPKNRPEEISRAIIELAENPGKAKKMGLAGYARVKEKFDLSIQVSAMQDLYYKAVS